LSMVILLLSERILGNSRISLNYQQFIYIEALVILDSGGGRDGKGRSRLYSQETAADRYLP